MAPAPSEAAHPRGDRAPRGPPGPGPNPPYLGLWTRLEDFRLDALTQLIHERKVVRCAMMRSTLHLFTARDFLRIRPVLQPVLERLLRGAYGKVLARMDLPAIVAAAQAMLSERPFTSSELVKRLREQWPVRDDRVLSNTVRTWMPLIHVPPAGTWDFHKAAKPLPKPIRTALEEEGARLLTCAAADAKAREVRFR